jgi:uncharacterized delta-60 repeat protein
VRETRHYTGHTRLAVIALALGVALSGAVMAFAADLTDSSFGEGGTVQLPPPPGARQLGVGPVVFDLAQDRRGRIVAALSDYTGEGGYFAAARFLPDGGLDTAFGANGFAEAVGVRDGVVTGVASGEAQGVAVQADGKIVVAGYQLSRDRAAPALVRFRDDGSLDPSFGDEGTVAPRPRAAGDEALHDVVVLPGGRIVAVGGKHERQGGPPAGLVVAYRPDGSVDRGFGKRGRLLFRAPEGRKEYTGFKAVRRAPGGKLLVAGYSRGRLIVARLTAAGVLDRGFGGDGKVVLGIGENTGCVGDCDLKTSLTVQPGNRILVAADRALLAPKLVRLRGNGTLDRSFGRSGVVSFARRLFKAKDLALDGRGRILVAGIGERFFSRRDVRIVFKTVRHLPDGKIDRGFGRGGAQTLPVGEASAAFAALTQASGRVVVGGGAQLADGGRAARNRLLLTRYSDGR